MPVQCVCHWQCAARDAEVPCIKTTGRYIQLVLVEKFKAHLVMIQRKSANPYARETEKGPRPGGAVKAPAFSSQLHLNSDCYTQPRATSIASTLIPTAYKRRQENLVGSETSTGSTQQP